MNYKGGKIKRSGYWYLKIQNHPNGGKQEYVAEHRLVMEKSLGRFLLKGEIVHHRNEIKTDNRIENLELMPSPGQHSLIHHPEALKKASFQLRGRPPVNKRVEKRNCKNCQKVFEVTKNSVKIFCSRQCYWIQRKGKRVSIRTEFKKGMNPWNKNKKTSIN